ncbi:zinc finger protein 585A-like [Dendropsophus ebraccatus]|uniref:zinc finger protein 585A-like n=1 Tax=Dendropsophus ebraccatus TaxID=150705 RepID=UPI003831CF63
MAAGRMDRDRKPMTERILTLTLEIIYLLTGEDYEVVKKSSGDYVLPSNCSCVSGDKRRMLSPIRESSPSLIHDTKWEQKIIELSNQITELLSGEVPVRCQDVTVYFSMEEWEYIEGHRDLYKDVMMKERQNLTSLDGNQPERCPGIYPSVPQAHQGENLTKIKTEVGETKEETHVIDQQCKMENIPVDICPADDYIGDLERHLLFPPGYGTEANDIIQDLCRQHQVAPQISLSPHSKEPSFDPCNDVSRFVNQSAGHSKGDILPNSECGIYSKKDLSKHKTTNSDEQPCSCSYCGTCFTRKSDLEKHQRSHKGGKLYSLLKHEKQTKKQQKKTFSCVDCGKCFARKSAFVEHKKIHVGNKMFSCSECFKTFIQKSSLVEHQRIHTGEKPFQCSECGKCFTQKSGLHNHQKIHRREKPFLCVDCGKSFNRKDNLERHQRIHRGEKPFCCMECGKCFIQRSDLYKHQRIHTRERPASCLTYEKIFFHKIVPPVLLHEGTFFSLTGPPRMDKKEMTEKILGLTLEILYLLTGEDYTVVKKTLECVTGRPQIPMSDPPPHSLIDENTAKILKLTKKMIELLTGEVPLRCQDVTVYFTTDEWEYIEGHKNLYRKMMENHRSLVSPGKRLSVNVNTHSSNHHLIYKCQSLWFPTDGERNPPETCHTPLFSQHCEGEIHKVLKDHQGEDLIDIKVEIMEREEETDVMDHHPCKEEEFPVAITTGRGPSKSTDGHLPLSADFKLRDSKQNFSGENSSGLYINYSSSDQSNHGNVFPVNSIIATQSTDQADFKMFSCFDCGECFTKESMLVKHQRIHTREKPFRCLECGKCFIQKINLVKHQRIHLGSQPFSCSECHKCFPKKPLLIAHQRIHKMGKPFPCSECGKFYACKSQLKIHQRVHTGEQLTCPECGKGFIQKSDLVRHLRIHTREKPFSCSECGKCYAQKTHFDIHQKTHTEEKLFAQFRSSFIQKSHLERQRTQIKEEPVSCPECGKCFAQKFHLELHQKSHIKHKFLICQDCGERFIQKSDLIRHQRTHTGGRPFVCSECGKCYAQKIHLELHQRTHTVEKPFSCSECKKCFTQKSRLVEHQKIHTGKNLFSCLECGKCFARKGQLEMHERTHTGEKPFSCLECGKCFTHKSVLAEHQRIHTGENLFLCLYCGKNFTRKSQLETHQRSHTGEKPYTCQECGKSFTQKSVLVRHQRIHTQGKVITIT